MKATTNSVLIDEETIQFIKETIKIKVREMFDDLGVTKKEFLRFGGKDVKGWLHKFEQYFRADNAPDEYKGLRLGIRNVVRRCNPKSLWSVYFLAKWEESSETVDNDIANEVLDEVSKVGDEVDEDNGSIDDQLLGSNCDQDGCSEDVNLGNCDQDGFGEDVNLEEKECERYKKDESCNHSYLGLIKLHEGDENKSNRNSFKVYKIVETRMTFDYLDTFMVRTTKLNVLMLIGSYGRHTHSKSVSFKVVIGTYKWCRSFEPPGFCLRDENWPIKNSVDCFVVGGMSEFNHAVLSQRTVEEEVSNALELVLIQVRTQGDTEEGTELMVNIFDSFESSYGESGKQRTGGNRIGLKGTFLDYVTSVGGQLYTHDWILWVNDS
nr:hypothetical protein [Tanacetum cinerariifolium]